MSSSDISYGKVGDIVISQYGETVLERRNWSWISIHTMKAFYQTNNKKFIKSIKFFVELLERSVRLEEVLMDAHMSKEDIKINRDGIIDSFLIITHKISEEAMLDILKDNQDTLNSTKVIRHECVVDLSNQYGFPK